VLSIRFEKQAIEVPMDEELAQFIQQIEPNSAKDDDIHVFHAYFQLYWPFKTEYSQSGGKSVGTNMPQVYRGYRIFQSY
jgi:hypothetical protein